MADRQLHMLSTIDNPYSPLTDWDRWYNWDESVGYHTTAFLGRVAILSPELSLTEQEDSIEDAIDEIVRENVLGVYIKVPIVSETV